MSEILRKSAAMALVTAGTGEGPNGSFDVLLSTPALDRDGDRLLTAEWLLPLPSHITFDIDHGMSVASTVGSGVPFITAEGNLRVLGHFASTALAQQTRALVNEGHIRTVSVAFLTRRVEGRTTRELLNGAFVAIPANPEALVLASKSHRTGASRAELIAEAQHLIAGHHQDPTARALAAAQATMIRAIAADARRL